MTGTAHLAGKRVLLVEDQFIIAMDLERVLKAAGCLVTGPVARLQPALAQATTGAFDFAILDVNLFGEKVFPVAEMLDQRGVPFVLTTGYGDRAAPPGREAWPIVNKPYDPQAVLRLMGSMLPHA